MSCPNFATMKYDMPLICGKTFAQMAEEYNREFGEELTDEVFYAEERFQAEDAERLAEEFTRSLEFHNVTVESGHYCSFQFFVEEKYSNYFDLDKNSRCCIDNDDAHYYFDMFRSQALRKADAEKRKIKKWLLSMKNQGFNLVHMTGMFSNGETTYCVA